MWKKFIRDYFTFTRKERNGLVVLLLLIFIVILWPSVYGWLHKDDPPDFAAFQKEIDSFQRGMDKSLPVGTDSVPHLSEIWSIREVQVGDIQHPSFFFLLIQTMRQRQILPNWD